MTIKNGHVVCTANGAKDRAGCRRELVRKLRFDRHRCPDVATWLSWKVVEIDCYLNIYKTIVMMSLMKMKTIGTFFFDAIRKFHFLYNGTHGNKTKQNKTDMSVAK